MSLQTPSVISQHSPYRVLGVGAACVDLLIPVDQEFFSAHLSGGLRGSRLCAVDDLKRLLDASPTFPKMAPGGSAANAIRGLAGLGVQCAFFSHVGADSSGEYFCQNLRELGITELITKLPEYLTPQTLCMIEPDGERTMRGFDAPVLDVLPLPAYFQSVEWVHIEARRLKNGACVERTMQLAQAAHTKISIDLSSFETVLAYKEILLFLLSSYVQLVFCNEDEVRALTGSSGEEGCFKLQKLCPIAVVTQGEKGCLVGHKDRVISSPAFPAKAVDTTGAGDLFASGFLYGALHGYPLSASARIGNRLGSAIVEVVGAELPEHKWTLIRKFLAEENI